MTDICFLPQNIRALRRSKNLTQRELAKVLLVSYQAISAWERGQSMPDLPNTLRIANYFGITMDQLLSQPEER